MWVIQLSSASSSPEEASEILLVLPVLFYFIGKGWIQVNLEL